MFIFKLQVAFFSELTPFKLQVTERSAVLESSGFGWCGIARNHADLVRFESPGDHDYCNIVLPKLHEFVKSAITNKAATLTDDERNKWKLAVGWLDPPDIDEEHNEAIKKHNNHKTTGSWLLESKKYDNWKNSAGAHLWVNGKSGSGKTILFSTVVSDLEKYCEGRRKVKIIKFYFTFRNSKKQTYSGLASSLVAQLAGWKLGFHVLYNAYRQYSKDSPTETLIENLLLSSARQYDRVFLCVDAIDECPEDYGARQDVLDGLLKLATEVPTIKIFATSQPVDEIGSAMERINAYKIALGTDRVKNDIGIYVDTEVQRSRQIQRLDESTRKEISQTLVNKADGSYELSPL